MAYKSKTKSVILSFRVTEDVMKELETLSTKNQHPRAQNVRSGRTLARRVVLDYAKGRVVYKDPDDFRFDREAEAEAAAEEKARANGAAADKKSRRAPEAAAPKAKGQGKTSAKTPRRKSS